MNIKSGAKTKNQGVAGEKVGQTWHRDNCSHAKKHSKNIETSLVKQIFPSLFETGSENVATSHSVVRQETIGISAQRTAFVWFFAQEVNWCLKDCDKQRFQTTVSIKPRSKKERMIIPERQATSHWFNECPAARQICGLSQMCAPRAIWHLEKIRRYSLALGNCCSLILSP